MKFNINIWVVEAYGKVRESVESTDFLIKCLPETFYFNRKLLNTWKI